MINKNKYSCSLPTLLIDLNKIKHNYNEFAKIANHTKIASMVKANAYGLGAVEVTKALVEEGCDIFFVANIDEAITLRKALNKQPLADTIVNKVGAGDKKGEASTTNRRRANAEDSPLVSSNITSSKVAPYIKICLLNGVFKDDVEECYKYNITPILNYLEQIKLWQNVANKYNKTLPAILHVNTGMYRLGIPNNEFNILLQNKKLLDNIKLDFIMSHLTSSEVTDSNHNVEQLNSFKQIIKNFPDTKASLVNSSGVLLGSEFHFDLVRVGAGLYGISYTDNNKISLQTPITLKAPIIQIQNLVQNTAIGYNRTYVTKKPSIVATLALGYADGYVRALSNKGYLFIEHYKVPIIGRISMDLLTIDITNVPENKVFLGQMVEIIGPNITPNEIATYSNTIGYEILTSLGSRYHRIYKH